MEIKESNEKKIVIIIIGIVAVLALILFLILYGKNNTGGGSSTPTPTLTPTFTPTPVETPVSTQDLSGYKELQISNIKYSIGGGYGTRISTATVYISINETGNVKLTNSYDSYTEEYTIDKETFNELEKFVNERRNIIIDGVEKGEGSDGSSSHLEILLKDGTTYKIGGYMIANQSYSEIVNKVWSTIGDDKYSEYRNNIGKDETTKN